MPGENSISFNLLRNFSVLSLICVVVISSVTAALLSRFLENNMLQGDAEIMKEFIERIAQHHDPTHYFSAADASRRQDTLNEFFLDISHMPDVVRINAYSRTKTVIWSNDSELIGRTFKDNHELDKALAGELAIEADLTGKSEHDSFDKKVTENEHGLVEIYIPIRASHNADVVGVAEVYKVPRSLAQSISAGRYLVWTCVSVGGAFLYLVLFWIVYHANGLIQLQHHALVKNARFAAIGEMAASVAHSIRNPLAAIRSSAELAQEEPGPAIAGHAGSIMEQVDRLDLWIRELLMFSRTPSDAETTACLREVIDSSLAGFADRPANQGITISVDLPADLPAVRGDSQLLVQVFNSLLANAVEAMPSGGRLSIVAEPEIGAVRVTIADTGSGIPEDKIHKLFIPLVTHKKNGLGVGLALARQILQRYGANIDLYSREGIGTTAKLIMPTT